MPIWKTTTPGTHFMKKLNGSFLIFHLAHLPPKHAVLLHSSRWCSDRVSPHRSLFHRTVLLLLLLIIISLSAVLDYIMVKVMIWVYTTFNFANAYINCCKTFVHQTNQLVSGQKSHAVFSVYAPFVVLILIIGIQVIINDCCIKVCVGHGQFLILLITLISLTVNGVKY